MAAFVRNLDEQVAERLVARLELVAVVHDHPHQDVFEPDPRSAERGGLVAAVGAALALRHALPGGGAVERQRSRRQVEARVVERHRPIDGGEGVEGFQRPKPG